MLLLVSESFSGGSGGWRVMRVRSLASPEFAGTQFRAETGEFFLNEELE